MQITKRHSVLVKVIAKFLDKTGFKDKQFRTEDLGVVFNLILQAQYNDGITIAVDGELIKDLFKLDEAIVNGGVDQSYRWQICWTPMMKTIRLFFLWRRRVKGKMIAGMEIG